MTVLVSCNLFPQSPNISATRVNATAQFIAQTFTSGTQTAFPTFTPTSITPTAFPYPNVIATPRPDQQVYIDLNGWYTIYVPADMKLDPNRPGSFSGKGSFIETGYLPELGYMSNIQNVCSWIANVESQNSKNAIDWYYETSPGYWSDPRCLASIKKVDSNGTVGSQEDYQIFENPGADSQHRFVYIKSGPRNPPYQNVFTFSWLKPIAQIRQDAELSPLTPEQTLVWEKTAPLLRNASVKEYAIPSGSDPYHNVLWEDVPKEALPDWATQKGNASTSYKEPTIQEQLKPLGYELRKVETSGGSFLYNQLYRDGRILFDRVMEVSKVYKFSTDSGKITAFTVNTLGTDGEYYDGYLIENDAIHKWNYSVQDPRFAPILYKGELLWLKATKDGQVQVMKSNREVVYTFSAYTEPLYSVTSFSTWNEHWVLSARDFLIQDGESINQKLGFQEIFNWRLVNNKPVYLFRKGSRIGFYYDGQILPLEYQDVVRYMCCGLAIDNPYISNDSARFFGKRNGVWYYVVVKFN